MSEITAVITDRHREALERLRPYIWSPHQTERFLRDLAELFPDERDDHAAKVRELEAEIRDLKSTASVVQVAMDCGSRLYEHSHRQLTAANERAERADRDNATMHSLLSDIAVFSPQFGEKIRAVIGVK